MSDFINNENTKAQEQAQNMTTQAAPEEEQTMQSPNEPYIQQPSQAPNEPFIQQPQPYAQSPYIQQNQYNQGLYPPNGYYPQSNYNQPNGYNPPNKTVLPNLKNDEYKFGKFEYIIWGIALALGIFLNRTVFAHDRTFFAFYSAFFWLAYLAAFTVIYWEKVKKKKLYWLSSFFIILLCSMSFIYDGNGPYTKLASTVVIPGTLLLTFMYGAFSISCYKPLQMLTVWLEGLFVFGFRNVSDFFHVIKSFFKKSEDSKVKSRTFRVIIGCLISLPIIALLGALLAASDEVFKYYLTDLLREFSIWKIIWNIILIFAFSSLIFSFLLNVQKPLSSTEKAKTSFKMDSIITYVVLTAVLVIYGLFCWVQFAYLFAGQGLPEGITYSEYAVHGFAEMIFVCSINLIAFGVVLLYTNDHNIKRVLLVLLLVFTGVMLTSAGVRLYLYIDSYDLTWLRLLSGWFILFMAMVLVICLVRLFTVKLPSVTVCFFVLLAWFSVLGLSNPQKTIIEYNITHAEKPTVWLQENEYYMRQTATSETVIYLLENGYGEQVQSWGYSTDYTNFLLSPYESPSIMGRKLRKDFPRKEYFPGRK